MSFWAAGATVVGSAISSNAAGKAAKGQAAAAQAAALAREQRFQEGKQLQMPFYQGGADAFSQLTQRLPELTQGYDPQRLTSEPGYEFGMREGQRALEQSLAARGRSGSGAALKAAARYGTDYSTTKLNDAFNRDRATRGDTFNMLTGTAGFGERVGTNISTQGNAVTGGVAGDLKGGADAAAAGTLSQGNIWGNLLNQGASMWNNRKKTPGGAIGGGGGFGTGRDFGNEDLGGYLADGGPVRFEPKIGTRAPRRAGGGGHMDRQAVLEALDVAWRDVPAAPQPGTVAALPADPVRNPRAIVEDRMRKAGAYADGGPVRGKTPGKADARTAHVSDGEHVIDAETVAMLGDGNTEAGHALLEELKQRVRQFKRQAPPQLPAPAMG